MKGLIPASILAAGLCLTATGAMAASPAPAVPSAGPLAKVEAFFMDVAGGLGIVSYTGEPIQCYPKDGQDAAHACTSPFGAFFPGPGAMPRNGGGTDITCPAGARAQGEACHGVTRDR